MFAYHCQHCQQRLLASAERAGQKTVCPKCLRPVTIPTAEDAAAANGELAPPHQGGSEVGFQLEDLVMDSPSRDADQLSFDNWPVEPIVADSAAITPPPPPPSRPRPPVRPTPPRQPEPPIPSSASAETPPPSRPRPAPQVSTAPVPVAVGKNGAVRTAPTPSRPAPLVTRKAEVTPSPRGIVVLNPTGMASVDLAAELTANLTMRMKPPQEPPTELRLSTALAVIMTLIGFGLWIAGVVMEPDPLPFVMLLGVLLLAVGWIWAIHLASLQGWMNAVIALFPPITVWYLVRPSTDNGARPLLYVICGVTLIGLFVVANPSRARFQQLMTALDPVKTISPTKPQSPAEKIRGLLERRNATVLQDYLESLSNRDQKTITKEEFDDEDRKQLTQVLKELLKPGPSVYDPGVRGAAVTVMARCCTADAREDVLRAVSAPERAVRRAALNEASRWPDVEMARAIAGRLSDSSESDLAQASLKLMGAPAETALVSLLRSKDPFFQMLVIALLEQNRHSSSLAIDALDKLSQDDPTENIRNEAARVAEVLRKAKKDK